MKPRRDQDILGTEANQMPGGNMCSPSPDTAPEPVYQGLEKLLRKQASKQASRKGASFGEARRLPETPLSCSSRPLAPSRLTFRFLPR